MPARSKIMMGLGLAVALIGPSCAPPADAPPPPPVVNPENNASGGPEEAFYHEDPVGDIFADGRQVPASIGARMHACGKVRYSVLGKVLATRGVNMANTAADSAAVLYKSGNLSLGAPSYASRSGEPDRNTTGGMTRLFDILIAAADEIIANMPNRPECQVGGVGAKLFNGGKCDADGFACLLGMPVSPLHVQLCNDMLSDAQRSGIAPATAQRLAVAAMAAPTYLCD